MKNLPDGFEINKPKMRYIAFYVCPDGCDNAVYYNYDTKDQIPATHPEDQTDLVRIVEVIETVLYDRDPTAPRKEESNSAEKNLPDQAV